MKSRINKQFRTALKKLLRQVRRQAYRAYRLFRRDPYHNSLQFKLLDSELQLYSVRIGLWYRALGYLQDREIVWFWIGSHSQYDKLISQL